MLKLYDFCDLYNIFFYSMYSWYGRKGKISAPQYIDLVMTHIQKHVEDESCLPSKYGKINDKWNNYSKNHSTEI